MSLVIVEQNEELNIKLTKDCGCKMNCDHEKSSLSYEDYVFSDNFNLVLDLKNLSDESKSWYLGENIKSVNCIVGKNGMGKTTILNKIHDHFSKNNKSIYIDANYIKTKKVRTKDMLKIRELYSFIKEVNTDFIEKSLSQKLNFFQEKRSGWIEDHTNYIYFKTTLNNEQNNQENNIALYKTDIFTWPCDSFLEEYMEKKSKAMDMYTQSTNSVDVTDGNNLLEKKLIIIEEFKQSRVDVGLSTGEHKFLELFYNLFTEINKMGGNSMRCINIILDEPDAHFHPEWSRYLLKRLCNFLEENFKMKFNLFISTHSPFILSDLPKESVHFLKKDEKIENLERQEKYMGEELNTLFIEKFFLEDNRGPIFSEKYVEVLNEVLINASDKDKCKFEKSAEALNLSKKIDFLVSNLDNEIMQNTLTGIKVVNNKCILEEGIE